jgi:uncharacterized protein YbjT (DUF2867 family)
MNKNQDLVLVTGVTGHQGGAVARELIAQGVKVRGMTRKPDGDAAKALSKLGIEIVAGDFDDEASLRNALKGAWGAFSVQNTWEVGVDREEEQGKRFAQIAKEAGIKHFVYTSVASAHRETGIPHFENKWRIEQTIKQLGFPSWTVIRPVFFMENLAGPWFLPGIQEGKLIVGIEPTTPLQMIAVQDIGKYGAWAFLEHESLNGRAIDIAGDELTMPQAAAILTQVMKRPVEFVQAPIEEVRKASADFAAMLEWFVDVGYDVRIASTSEESGIRPTKFQEWAEKAPFGSPVNAP